MSKLPRTVNIGNDAKLGDVITRLNEFARDTIASLEARPRVLIRELDFVGGSTNRDVETDLRQSPLGAWIVSANVKTSPQSSISGPLYLDWSWVGPAVRVRGITGLTGGVEYTVRIAMVEAS